MNGSVYFVKCGEFVKIGFALNVEARMRDLRTGNPHELELLAIIDNVLPSTEKVFHNALHAERHRCEWFRLTHPIARLIRCISDGQRIVTEPQIRAAMTDPLTLPAELRDVFMHTFIFGRVDKTACQHLRLSRAEYRARREAVERLLEQACA